MKAFRASRAAMIAVLSLFALFSLTPFYFLLISSFKPGVEMIRSGISLNPHFEKFTLNMYKLVFSLDESNFFIWYKNSLLYTCVQTVLGLGLTSFVGYGLGVYKFKGRNAIFVLVLLVMMVPLEIMMIPLYKEMIALRLFDSMFGVVLPFAVFPSAVFFFRQYSSGLPLELMDAGRIDGLTEYGIFFRVMIPLLKPAFGAMTILISMNCWNAIVWPMVVLRNSKKLTIPIGLSTLITPYGNNYDLLMPGAVLAIVPIILIFILNQRSFIEGLTTGGVKG
ncbi:MAG: carbohydrate ABC transporter permease [Clostridiales bacterium]|jgi:arabinosaccharide transport system permease protein|nr:carbohydrate ABC transporter permease [Clostridiales bacterium]